MQAIFGITLTWILASQALAAPAVVIPDGGAGVGSLSVISPATGTVERSLVTAVASTGVIKNSSFTITNAGENAAVVGFSQRNPASSSVYILSVVNIHTGRITGQRELSFVRRKGPVLVRANPKRNVLYFGFVDPSANFHIQAIDPANLHVILDSNLGVDGGQSMIVSPDGETIYLSGDSHAAVAAVRASNLRLIGTIPIKDSSFTAVSPDSSTLYVAAGDYPNMALTVVKAATLQVTQTVPFASVSVVFGLAISPDGSQLYLPGQANFQGTDIFTLDLPTQAVMAVPAVVRGNIAVSPGGTVYVGNGSGVVVFDPASQSVTGTLSAFSNGSLALNSTGSELYFLNEYSSTLAATGPPPQQAVLDIAATGVLSSAAYDATNNLLLVADTANNLEVPDARTFELAGQLFIPDLSGAYLTAWGGSGFATMGVLPQVLRFDPVSLQVTGTVSLRNRIYDTISYSQPVMSGSTLYVPFAFTANGGPIMFADASVPANGIAVIDTIRMKLVATWPFRALPLLGLNPGRGVAYAVVPAGQQMLDLDKIDLSTGEITRQVHIPGQNTSDTYSNPAVSQDGSTIYFSTNNILYAFNAQTLAITSTVTGIGLTNLTVSPEGNFLYGGTPVPCEDCSEQIVFTFSLKVIGTIPVSTAYPEPALFLGN